MLTRLKTRSPKLFRALTAALALAAVGGGAALYESSASADCCAPGAPCCHPGAACCAAHKHQT